MRAKAADVSAQTPVIAASAAQPQRLQLPNGMQLIVERVPDAPLTAIEVWIRAGVADETPETSGVAHLLEHLIFKGTADLPPGALDEAFEQAGGVLDASTERDWTRYYATVLPDRWQAPLRTLLRCLLYPALPKEELEKERRIILNDEYALHRADPIRPARYTLFAEAFPTHTYRLPLLGDPETLARIDVEAIRRFHQAHYRPERIVVALVGAVDMETARRVVEEVVGSPHPLTLSHAVGEGSPLSPTRWERGSGGEGIVAVQHNACLALGVRTPPVNDIDGQLCAEIVRIALAEPYLGLLYEGENRPFGRLHSEYLPRVRGSLLALYALPPVEPNEDWQVETRERFERGLQQIVDGDARTALEQARAVALMRHTVAMRNFAERARWYGLCAVLQIPLSPEEYAARLKSLPVERIEAFVEATAGMPSHHESGDTLPLWYDGIPAIALPAAPTWCDGIPAVAHRTPSSRYDGIPAVALPAPPTGCDGISAVALPAALSRCDGIPAVALPAPPTWCDGIPAVAHSAVTRRNAVRQRLSNGLRVVAVSAPDAETVVIQVAVAHTIGESAAVGELTARMLFGETQNETSRTLAMRIARSGGSLRIEWTPAGALITAFARPDSVVNVLSLLKEALFRAEFSDAGLRSAKQQALYDRQYQEGAQGWRLAARLLNAYADEETLRRVSLREVRAYYQAHYRPENACIAIVGNFPAERLIEFAQQFFGHEWEASSAPKRQAQAIGTMSRTDSVSDPRGLRYTGYAWASPLESASDYYALRALQVLLTEGKRARLFTATREQQGIGYAVQMETALVKGGALGVGWAQTGKTPIPESALQDALAEPVQPEEWRRVQALLRGEWERLRLNLSAFTASLAWAELSGLGYQAVWNAPAELDALTLEQVETCRSRLLKRLKD